MKKTKKSLRRITATLVAMAASASFVAAPILGAGITFGIPSFSASAADTDVLTYNDFSYKVTENGIVITAYNGSETNPVIPSVIDETAVTAIGGSAFYNCTALTEIEIPSSVTNIGEDAFKNCSNLEKLALNEGLKTLGANCFENTKISSVNIPSTLTAVNMPSYDDKGPFKGCKSLKNVTFDNKVTKIINYLFDGCSGLETITIPETITVIGESAFEECTALTEIEIPSSVTNIGCDAFYYCSNLEKLTLNEGLKTIGANSFQSTKISSVNIPSTLTAVNMPSYDDEGPFKGCKSLKNVTFDNKVTKIINYLFDGCSGLETITIPETITVIGESAFEECTNFTEVEIPSSVTSIDRAAFSKTNLTEIEIPSSVTNIGCDAFYYCSNLEKLTLNEGLKTIGANSFQGTKISSVNIPSTLTSVNMPSYDDHGPFYKSTTLKKVTIADNAAIIPDYLFENCSGLETIDIPSAVQTIGKSAFRSCTNLTEIEIPSSVTNIGCDAFYYCSNLEKLTLNEGLKTLGANCFEGTKISSVNIPSTLTAVNMPSYDDHGPFYKSTTLKEVTIDDNAAIIPGYLFEKCSALETIDIPYAVRTIGISAFENCTSLKDITIHNPYCNIYNKDYTISSGATIHGYTPSTAKNYAQSFEREFVSLGSFTLGDVNVDGTIDASDASIVLAEYALIQTGNEPTFTEIETISADVNKDGIVDASDASKILAYYAMISTGKNPTWD